MVWGDEEPKVEEDSPSEVLIEDVVKHESIWGDDNSPKIQKDVVEKKVNWLEDTQETIMIYGLPKHGKTFAYCSIIEHFINKGGNIYVISTDAGFVRTVKSYFGDKIDKVFDKIDLKQVFNITSIRNYYNDIKDKLKKEDLLIIDLCSDVWEWAQIDFVERLSHDDIENFIAKAMRDPAKFGMFDSSKWNYIKALHKFVEDIIIRKPCSFVGVCNEKDTSVEIARGGMKVKEMMMNLGLQDLTSRPGGMKLLPYKFETIIRIGVEGKHYFMQIIGDRGYHFDLSKHFYGKNLYQKLLEWRKAQK